MNIGDNVARDRIFPILDRPTIFGKKNTHQLNLSEVEKTAQFSLSSDKIQNMKVTRWDGKVAIGFRLEEYKGSRFRRHDSTIILTPKNGKLYMNGELRFPYSKDNEELNKANGATTNFLQEKGFNTKSWVIPSTGAGGLGETDYWSSHIHYTKTISSRYLTKEINYISKAIDEYYKEVVR